MAGHINQKLSNIDFPRDNQLMATTEDAGLSRPAMEQTCGCGKTPPIIRQRVDSIHKIHQFAADFIFEAGNRWKQSRFRFNPARQFLQIG
ncbi:hypothetical protein A6U86_02870 [Rhizobium sp. AC27/96]|uniref:hypothetical protein n=1 Tax=Rhizobium TaxID=379 RepID=UPI000827F5C3|nr:MULTISPECIES: hypothetical protein [Rhizobium]OCJ12013.1 hypothetical protein A6U86_02870 [Rhizobium sp. AC27/96]